jgi:hypothetical protein
MQREVLGVLRCNCTSTQETQIRPGIAMRRRHRQNQTAPKQG